MDRPTKAIDELRIALIHDHEDGSDDSTYMKFGEIMHYVEFLEWELRSYKSILDVIASLDKKEVTKIGIND